MRHTRSTFAGLLALTFAAVLASPPAAAADPITLDSLLREMTDRQALARFPDPAYTCKQFSSYDPASKTPDDAKSWFANGDAAHYLRVEEVKIDGGAGVAPTIRKEWVLVDMDGPGAIVRIWSANPFGTLRIYLDGNTTPAIEAPMADLLGGKWKIAKPLSEEVSKGWNLYLPIPYARHCKITASDLERTENGKKVFHGFYYQVNYRTYPAGTTVTSCRAEDLARLPEIADELYRLSGAETADARPTGYDPVGHDKPQPDARVKETDQKFLRSLLAVIPGDEQHTLSPSGMQELAAGKAMSLHLPAGPRAIHVLAAALAQGESDQAFRSTVLSIDFDGEQTVWAPIGDFFASGVGRNPVRTRYFFGGIVSHLADYHQQSFFVMPYARSCTITVTNLGTKSVQLLLSAASSSYKWTPRSMHFHATWRHQHPIHAYGGRGTEDWNYVDIQGKGVYVGDSLAVMNPVPDWWGEGDEKVYVDGETFPSHFGTGTEDYYGYAWCWPAPFQHPFHAQSRCDGFARGGNNWGHTTVSRVRALDGIPFTRSLKFDMEVWHWKECDVAYAATTFFYALPGAKTNRTPDPAEAAKPIPQPPPLPPPFKIPGAIECESMKIVAKSEGLTVTPQDMRTFGRGKWSGETHLWVQGRKPGDFVELEIPTGPGPEGQKPVNFVLYATRSWDYGMIKFIINGEPSDVPEDLYSGARGKADSTGAIHLGVFHPRNGKLTLRAEVVGGNERSEGTKSFFGLDCVVLTPAPDHDHP